MTDSLKTLMTRLADEADPAAIDPMLWQRARQSRRRDRWAVAAVVVAATVAATGSALVFADRASDGPPPADAPAEQEGPGIPSDVYDPVGNGGLELEKDLAVGRASVAIANDSAAFVISADDGAYHRLDLPGFDPALYDAGGSEVSGLTLSPDGTKLIYGWQGDPGDPKASGARVADLLSGEVTTLGRQALYDEPARLLPWGFSWSPDSRLVLNRVKIADPDAPWGSDPYWGQGLDTETGEPVAITERTAGLELRPDDDLASTGRIASSGLEARFYGHELAIWVGRHGRNFALPKDEYWVSGRFDSAEEQLLIEPDRIAGSLLLVGNVGPDVIRGAGRLTTTVLRLTDGPADVSLLGWVGDEHALAILDEDLVLLTIDAESGEADGTVVGEVSFNDDNSDLSFATELASVGTPSIEFETGSPTTTQGPESESDAGGTSRSDGWSTAAVVGTGAAVLLFAAALVIAIRRRA